MRSNFRERIGVCCHGVLPARHRRRDARRSAASPGEDDLLLGYSFGFWISDPSIHPGSNGPELSDQGAFGCTPWVDFDLGYSAVLLIKDRTRTGTEIWNAIRPIIIEEIE